MNALLFVPTRVLFFTGKGGVGKTSAACATAIWLADAGKRVLLVSTDPASNLDEVLGVTLDASPKAVPGVSGLAALNIDPEQAARAYRERVVGPYRGVLPATAVASIEEQLSGACTVEIAAFDEFSKLLGDADATRAFDHVIFDTAPTGHTLRLLELPAAWSTFIETNVGGTSCLGPLSGLKAQQALYAASHAALRDETQTTLVLVARPDAPSLAEAERTRSELHQLGIRNVRLILNGVFHAHTDDPIAVALATRGRAALEDMPAGLRGLPRIVVPLLPFGLVGVDALRQMGTGGSPAATRVEAAAELVEDGETLNQLVEQIAARGKGVVMTMGKGGVGKTTLAAAHRHRARPRGPPGNADHDRSRSARGRGGPGAARDAARHSHRSGCGNPALHRGGARDGRPGARRARSRAARRRPALAVHGGDRGLSRLRRHRRAWRGSVRRHRHGADRPHVAALGRGRGVSP